jgi:hypothetical protein
MSDKKGKALIMKLIDDLIDDEVPDQPKDQKKKTGIAPASKAQSPPEEPADLDISDIVQIDEGAQDGGEDRNEAVLDLYARHDQVPPADHDASKGDDTRKLTASRVVNDQKAPATDKFTTDKLPVDKGVTDKFQTGKGSAPHSETVRDARPDAPPTEKAAVGRYSPLRSGGFSSATEAALATSENLRIAQTRILELEQELSRLRTNNEQLAAAGETLRRRADELLAQNTSLQGRLERTNETKDQEIEILRQAQLQKDKEVNTLRMKIEEMEMRLSSNIQKIRVRERELENRLELVKMESTALVRNKDEIILDLKRQVDQLNLELENYRNKGQELNKQLGDKQEILRRTVKALRIALSMLEGEDDANAAGGQKKVK